MHGDIKGCKTIPEVGVAIRLPESKMAAKLAAKMKQTLKTFSMQYAHLSVDIQRYHIACIVQWSDSCCWTSLVLHTCHGLSVYAVYVCNMVRLPGTGQSAHVIGGSRFTRPASNSRRALLN